MILGPPYPQAPTVSPLSFIDFLLGWDPCLGLEVPWPHLRSCN